MTPPSLAWVSAEARAFSFLGPHEQEPGQDQKEAGKLDPTLPAPPGGALRAGPAAAPAPKAAHHQEKEPHQGQDLS
jgi:hypothetical protein